MTDGELIHRFAQTRDQEAFAELVRRHGGMVLATARRLAGQEAQDVSQAVFMLLARKARGVARHGNLAGWLHQTTRYCSANAKRIHRRQLQRIQDAMGVAMRSNSRTTESDLTELLDAALARLPAEQREAVLLRYMEGLSLGEAAQRLAISGDAVAKRCERGLTRLRAVFASKGVVTAAGAIVGVMMGQAGPISEAQAMSLTQAGMGVGSSAAATSIASATAGGMMLAKLKVAAAIALVGMGAGTATLMALQDPGQAVPDAQPAGPPGVVAVMGERGPTQQEARDLGERFLVALRDANEQAVFEMIDAPRDQERRALAAGFVIEFRLGPYARYPQRLGSVRNSRFVQDRAGALTDAMIIADSPILAEVRQLTVRLAPVEGQWKVKEARMSDSALPKWAAAEPATQPAGPIDRVALQRALDSLQRFMKHAREIESMGRAGVQPAQIPLAQLSLEGMKQSIVDLAQALRSTDLAISEDDTAQLTGLCDRAIAALTDPDPRAVFNVLQGAMSSKELAGSMQRIGALPQTLSRRMDEANPGPAAARPPSFGPAVKLTLGWDGTVVEIPGPVTIPSWLRATHGFKLWQQRHNVETFRTTDDAGNIYLVNCMGASREADGTVTELIPSIAIYRPDGTLAATAESVSRPFASWATYDSSGKRYVTRVMASGEGGTVSQVEFFDSEGQRRVWTVHKNRVWLESTSDPIGESNRSVNMSAKE